jgi:hypothetical protein
MLVGSEDTVDPGGPRNFGGRYVSLAGRVGKLHLHCFCIYFWFSSLLSKVLGGFIQLYTLSLGHGISAELPAP